MKWVTRERPKIDRIACWSGSLSIGRRSSYTCRRIRWWKSQRSRTLSLSRFWMSSWRTTGLYCSFDAIIKKYKIIDPAAIALAEIVRAADTDTLGNSPQ